MTVLSHQINENKFCGTGQCRRHYIFMARGKRGSKYVGGPLHSSIRQSDSQPLEHNRPSVSAGRFELFLPGCSPSLGTKDAFKKNTCRGTF